MFPQPLRSEFSEAAARALAVEALKHLGSPWVGVVAGRRGLRGGEIECSRAEHIGNHRRLELEGAECEQSGKSVSTFPCHLGRWRVGRPVGHAPSVDGGSGGGPLHLLGRVRDILEELGQRAEHSLVALEVSAHLALAELLLGASDIPGSKARERALRDQSLQVSAERRDGEAGWRAHTTLLMWHVAYVADACLCGGCMLMWGMRAYVADACLCGGCVLMWRMLMWRMRAYVADAYVADAHVADACLCGRCVLMWRMHAHVADACLCGGTHHGANFLNVEKLILWSGYRAQYRA